MKLSESMLLIIIVKSPSLRRVWVEIVNVAWTYYNEDTSPSLRRVWVEIYVYIKPTNYVPVTLLAEGVG